MPADPWQLIHVARMLGSADVTRDALGDQMILAQMTLDTGDLPFEITFYDCHLGRDCSAALLTVRFPAHSGESKPLQRQTAMWNREKLIGRAWLEAENRLVLDHSIVFGDGLPKQSVEATMIAWRRAIREAVNYFDISAR